MLFLGRITPPLTHVTCTWVLLYIERSASKRFTVDLTGTYTTHRFIWDSTSVFVTSDSLR
jgi:hypothetical protein